MAERRTVPTELPRAPDASASIPEFDPLPLELEPAVQLRRRNDAAALLGHDSELRKRGQPKSPVAVKAGMRHCPHFGGRN